MHNSMDRAVLNAFGWNDIPTDCEFLLDYEIDEENWNPRKKKPYRYRWPDEIHDEVLARLLELNEHRAQEEADAALDEDVSENVDNDETESDHDTLYMEDMFS